MYYYAHTATSKYGIEVGPSTPLKFGTVIVQHSQFQALSVYMSGITTPLSTEEDYYGGLKQMSGSGTTASQMSSTWDSCLTSGLFPIISIGGLFHPISTHPPAPFLLIGHEAAIDPGHVERP